MFPGVVMGMPGAVPRTTVTRTKIDGVPCFEKRFRERHQYLRERNVYVLIGRESFVPDLLAHSDRSMTLFIEDVGVPLCDIDINLKDREDELLSIIDTLRTKFGLYHNDMRPGNIVLGTDGRLKVIDFEHTSRIPAEDPYLFRSDQHGFPRIYY